MMGESSVDRNSGAVRVFFAVTSEPVINDRRSQPETKIDLAKLASKAKADSIGGEAICNVFYYPSY